MQEFLNKVDKTLLYYNQQVARYIRGKWWDVARTPVTRPVFIVGCSRAGTTLVYKTFAQSRELGALNRETHDFWAALHPIEQRQWDSHTIPPSMASDQDRNRVARYFYAQTGTSRFVDKNNQNGLSIPYLLSLFPDASFVYVKRSPGDNVNSLIEGWRRADEYASWSDNLPEAVSVEGGEFTRWCFFLPEGWRNYLESSIEEVCAWQYEEINRLILEAKSMVPSSQWTEIKYEDLLVNPVQGFRDAFNSVGLSFTPTIEQHCEQILDKPYNAFSEIKLDKWREGRNRERIEKVMQRLHPVASRMGYD